MPRRMGRPGLVGTMARTAVVAGTATAVHGGMTKHQQKKAQGEYDEQMAQQQAYDNQAQLADMQRQLDEAKAAQAQPAQAQPAAASPAAVQPAPAAGGGEGDLVAELSKLADLKSAGILSDEEFAAAKAKLLAG